METRSEQVRGESPVAGLARLLRREWLDHGHRVAWIAGELGRVIDLSAERIQRLTTAALLHDIGKSRLSATVLGKPRPLAAGERQHVHHHPRLGFEMVRDSVHLEVALAVLHHHERFDGSGYPARLMAYEIPLLARVLAVADAFDAMMSDRCYRRRVRLEIAIDELERNAGSQFDPFVVEALVSRVCTFERLIEPAGPPQLTIPPAERPGAPGAALATSAA